MIHDTLVTLDVTSVMINTVVTFLAWVTVVTETSGFKLSELNHLHIFYQ